jgi:hypothetical protein
MGGFKPADLVMYAERFAKSRNHPTAKLGRHHKLGGGGAIGRF